MSDLEEFLILPKICDNVEPSWFGFLISVKPNDKISKQAMVEFLEKSGIGTRQLFAGNILRQPMMTEYDIPLRINNSELLNSRDLTEDYYAMLPNTDFIMNNTFWVGVYPGLEEQDLNKISKLIHLFIKERI